MIAFLKDMHNCEKKNEKGEWTACFSSFYFQKSFCFITDCQPTKVEYVEVCPICNMKFEDMKLEGVNEN